MSRSLSAYPWRVQHDNVPFFTFPSTPPSFLAANHYPYTFAPPISINQIAPGPAGPVPSYAGIAVPNVTGVDAVVSGPVGTTFPVAALTSLTEIPPEQLHNVPPGAVAVTIAGGNHPVTGQTVVIQQEHGMQNQDVAVFQAVPHQPHPPQHPIHVHHGHAQYPPAQHIAPAIIARGDGPPQPGAGVIQPGPSVIQHGPLVAAVPPPQLISVAGGPHHAGVMGVSLAHSGPPQADQNHSWRADNTAINQPENQHSRHMGSDQASRPPSGSQYQPSLAQSNEESSGLAGPVRSRSSNNATIALISDEPGPSRINPDPASPSEDSEDFDSPGTQLTSMLYRRQHFPHYDNDSDDSSATDLDSGDSLSYQHEHPMSNLSGEGQLLISGDDSSGLSDSESDEVTNPSTLRMINMNSAVVNVHPLPPPQGTAESSSSESSVDPSVYVLSEHNPGNQVEMEEESESPSDDDNVNLPPLITINLSSDPETPISSQAETPPSIIDLTASSTNSSPNLSEVNNMPGHHAPSSEDQRMYVDRMSRSSRSNLFNRETSGEVLVVPAIRQQQQHHQQHSMAAAATGDVEDPSHANNSFVMNPAPEMAPIVGVVATSQSHDFHHGTHSVVQLAQPHAHQHFIALQSQQQDTTDPSSQHTHHASRHSHVPPTDQPPQAAAQPIFQFPQPAPHAGEGGGVAIQQVSTLPPPGAVAPMEPGPPSVNTHGVHVLTWQQRLPGK